MNDERERELRANKAPADRVPTSEVSEQVRERLVYIEDLLFWFGRAGRADLMQRFGISAAAATKDLGAYRDLQPTPLLYDGRSRAYRPHGDITAMFTEQTLDRLIRLGSQAEAQGAGFLDIRLLQPPARNLNLAGVSRISRAIAQRLDVLVIYQSVTSGRTERWITPHALASDGIRWHARAYDHAKERFADFVLSRVAGVRSERASATRDAEDREWLEFEDIVMVPNPGLSPAARETVMLDFGMQDGCVVYRCRKAMAFYARKRFMLTEEFTSLAPAVRQVVELTQTTGR